MKLTYRVILSGFLLCFVLNALAQQDRFTTIEKKLQVLSGVQEGLNANVDLSVNGVSIQEFIRGIAINNSLNVNVDPALDMKVVNNFVGVPVKDVFLFLCKKYELEINFMGSIISFSKYIAPVKKQVYQPKEIDISYDKAKNLLSFDLQQDTLIQFSKKLTQLSDSNIIVAPELTNLKLSGFIKDMPFSQALEQLAFSNGFFVSKKGSVYTFQKKPIETEEEVAKNKKGKSKNSLIEIPSGFTFEVDINKRITADAVNVPIGDVIAVVSEELNYNYFRFSEIRGSTSLKIKDATFDDFLHYLLNGTEFTYKKENDIYLLGGRSLEGLRTTKVVPLQYRTVEKVVEFIPAELKKGVDIKVFPDLNSLILSGSGPNIHEIETFLRKIDRVVPMVMIEVMIVDVRKSTSLATGIQAGLTNEPVETGGSVFPGIDISISSSSLNELITGVNGLGVINLGKVTPQFYATLKLMESQGNLKLESTPKLSTLNGHQATLSIGKTEYYLETQNTVIGTQNPQNVQAQQYKSVNADLSLTIQPMVSGDEHITMDMNVKQSNFTERIAPSAPPGKITRNFQSMIRVKNGETVILGGLDENSKTDSGSGVPLLSRIPVIKWLFSSRTKARSKGKLVIFIKPTVIY